MIFTKLFLLSLLAGLALPLAAQTYTPKTLAFTGADDYKTADLTAVTGLIPGKPVTSSEIDIAMQHLVDTGLFSDMRYSVNDKALTFALVPVSADQLLTARYSNFVWWKQEDLTPLVHARIPLFTGKVPVTGTMKDQVASVLAALVLEKGIKAEVTSLVFTGNVGKSTLAREFSITDPVVKVGEVHIDNVSAAVAPKVSEIKRRFAGQDYDVEFTSSGLDGSLQDAYFDLGYLDFATGPFVIGPPQITSTTITIDVSTTAREGAVYHVSQMVWPDSVVVPKPTLIAAAQLKQGDPASRILLLSTIAKAGERFAAVGYVDAKVAVDSRKDDARHEIAYTFAVEPGEQYRFASVKTLNLSAEQQAEFDKNWKLAPGQVYNEDYVHEFMKKSLSMKVFQGYSGKFDRRADPKTRLVTVTFSYNKLGSRPS